MKKTNFKKTLALISTFAIALNSTVMTSVYASELDENNIVSNGTQTAHIEDVLTLNAYYNAETSRVYSEMCITYTEKMPEIYCSYDNENFVLTEASAENKYSFTPNADSDMVYVKAVQTLSDGSEIASEVEIVNMSEALVAAYSDSDLGYVPDAHLAEPIAVLSTDSFPINFAEMIYKYPDNSYFSQTGKACRCHNDNCDNDYKGGCDCIPYEDSLQCMAFAKLAFHCTHGKKLADVPLVSMGNKGTALTPDLAKSLFMNTAQRTLGTYIRVKPNNYNGQHSIAIINTSANGLTVYHANYGAHCIVRYQNYTWDSFAQAFPTIYNYAK